MSILKRAEMLGMFIKVLRVAQVTAKGINAIASLGVVAFGFWLFGAATVDIVSTATVHYGTPVWGVVLSLLAFVFSWAVVYGIKFYAESLLMRIRIKETEQEEARD